MTATLAAVDLETSGLNADQHEFWEAAIILRTPDGTQTEYLWQRRLTELHIVQSADPVALDIGGYWKRRAVPAGAYAADMLDDIGDGQTPVPMGHDQLSKQLRELLTGATLIGSNPDFDARFLRVFLGDDPWHYKTLDIATLAAGYQYGQAASPGSGGDFLFDSDYPQVPYKSYVLSRAVGVEPPAPGVAHTALGDARWALAVYDAITTRNGHV